MNPKDHYRQLDWNLKNRIKYLIPDNLRNLVQKRHFHSFCIGTPKSGTTSVAGLFDKNYRSSHEPERRSLIFFINDHYKQKITDEQYVAWLKKRDKRVWLDIESNCFLGYRIDLLYRAFPHSKYILSVREPLSWLDSMINHTINYSPASEDVIALWHKIFFRPDQYPHPSIEQPLQQAQVYSIEAYLRYWSMAINAVLETIPDDQLLIIKTNELQAKADKLASFLGVETHSLDFSSGHLNKAPAKYDLLEKIPPDYLQQKIFELTSATCKKIGFNTVSYS
jgi:hypothetical protein